MRTYNRGYTGRIGSYVEAKADTMNVLLQRIGSLSGWQLYNLLALNLEPEELRQLKATAINYKGPNTWNLAELTAQIDAVLRDKQELLAQS